MFTSFAPHEEINVVDRPMRMGPLTNMAVGAWAWGADRSVADGWWGAALPWPAHTGSTGTDFTPSAAASPTHEDLFLPAAATGRLDPKAPRAPAPPADASTPASPEADETPAPAANTSPASAGVYAEDAAPPTGAPAPGGLTAEEAFDPSAAVLAIERVFLDACDHEHAVQPLHDGHPAAVGRETGADTPPVACTTPPLAPPHGDGFVSADSGEEDEEDLPPPKHIYPSGWMVSGEVFCVVEDAFAFTDHVDAWHAVSTVLVKLVPGTFPDTDIVTLQPDEDEHDPPTRVQLTYDLQGLTATQAEFGTRILTWISAADLLDALNESLGAATAPRILKIADVTGPRRKRAPTGGCKPWG